MWNQKVVCITLFLMFKVLNFSIWIKSLRTGITVFNIKELIHKLTGII